MRNRALQVLSGGAVALSASLGLGAVATFEGTAGAVDSYPGATGSGWAAAWQVSASGSASVVNTDPLKAGSNNYLQFTNGSSTDSTLARQITTPYTSAFTVSFDLRVDSLQQAQGLSIGFNRYQAANGGNASVQMRTVSSGSASDKVIWVIYHGTDLGTDNTGAEIKSSIEVTQGAVQHFEFNIDPVTGTFDVSINNIDIDSSGSTAGYTYGERFNFRCTTTAVLPAMPDSMKQSWFAIATRTNGTVGEQMVVSLDNLSIALVPEPASMGVLGLMGACLLVGRRRQR